MIQSQEMSGEEKAGLSDDVNESLGLSEDAEEEASNESNEPNELPSYAKKKLGMQEKRHKKELRRMQQQLDEVHSKIGSFQNQTPPEQQMNGYSPDNNQHNDPVYAAVSRAMQMQKEQEQKAKQAEQMQHLNKQYRALDDHLDNESDKYDDFHDVVKSDDAPYTGVMRDMSVILHGIPGINAAEVLYKLGKDRDKLHELSKKTPVEQSREVLKLAIALMNGGNKSSSSSSSKQLGSIKNSPMNTTHLNENTSISDLRKKMLDGGKKWSR
jgi:hypothetical protein